MTPSGRTGAEVPRTAAEIRQWLAATIGDLLGIPPERVDGDLPFARFGLDSARIHIMLGDFADWLGVELSASILLDYPTINTLSRRLGRDGGAAPDTLATRPIVRFGSRDAPNEEPIAIVGIGCRYPGAADSPDAFWRVIAGGVDCVREVPGDRWNADDFYSRDPAAPGRSISKRGGFIDNIDKFDAKFFGISPREAPLVDPQQRVLLETAWEALEDAGIPADGLAGSHTGVYVGYCYSDFVRRTASGGLAEISPYSITGLNDCIAANRISFFFDLRGPSMVLHTASSSSLVAVHQACVSLWVRECDLALAGGITLALSPAVHVVYTKAGAMSPDSCRPFDASATGMVRGEGGGFVVLRRLSAAQAAGDRIYAVILSSAVSQDGRTNGLAAPSQDGIERTIRMAWRRSGRSPSECQYVEAHGTGTVIGDLVEGNAIAHVMGTGRAHDEGFRIGSLKSNFGHAEAGAGVAGLIKVALSTHHRQLAPTLHLQTPNPDIPWAASGMSVQTELSPWPRPDQLLLAGVTSLGLGGTNAHVVVSEPPLQDIEAAWTPAAPIDPDRTVVLPISARSADSLRALAERYLHLLEGDATELEEVAASAATRRAHLSHRLAVVASSRVEAAELLRGTLRGETGPGVVEGRATGGQTERPVFVFSGQGSQWAGMGTGLMAAGRDWAPFQESMRECDRLLRGLVGWSLLEEIARPKETSALDQTHLTQPALFCLQMALAAQWAAFGVLPAAVIGHSSAEVTAACVAGALEFEEGLRLMATRGKLLHRASGLGKMIAVELTPTEAEALLAPTGGRAVIAGYNSPSSLTLAGDPEIIEALAAELEERKVFHRVLRTSTAFHSPLMDPMRPELVKATEHLRPRPTEIPMISTVTGRQVDGRSLDSRYWGRHLREPVRFASAIAEASRLGFRSFVEVGPHQVLSVQIAEAYEELGQEPPAVVPTLLQRKPERETMLSSLATMWTRGQIDAWSQLYPGRHRFVSLPTYAWERRRWWKPLEQPWPEMVPVAVSQTVERQRTSRTTADLQDAAGTSPLLARLADFGLTDDAPEVLSRDAYQSAPPEGKKKLIENLLQRLVAQALLLKLHEVESDRPLRDTGIDSISVVRIRQGLRTAIGVAPPVGQFFDGSSIRTLAGRLVTSGQGSGGGTPTLSADPAVWVHAPGAAKRGRHRLICLPHAGGGARQMAAWANDASANLEIVPIQLPGREERSGEPLITRLHVVVPALAAALSPWLDRPYALFGHSLGSLVAFELARELRRVRAPQPTHLFASASTAPHLMWTSSGEQRENIHRLSDEALVEYLIGLGNMPAELVADREALAAWLPVLRADFEMADTYVYTEASRLSIPITAFGGRQDTTVSTAQLRAWAAETTRSFSLRMLDGGHHYHMDAEARRELLGEISHALAGDAGGFARPPSPSRPAPLKRGVTG